MAGYKAGPGWAEVGYSIRGSDLGGWTVQVESTERRKRGVMRWTVARLVSAKA